MEGVCRTWEVCKRELKSYFESPVAYVFLIVFLVLTGFLTFGVSHYYEYGQADLRVFFFWHPWVYLLLVPAASMRLWAEERRSGTIELLLTLPLTLGQAIVGKFLAAWAFLGIALAMTFPVVVTTAYLGNPDSGVVIGGYLGSLFLAGTCLSVGLLTSAMTRNQVISFVLSLVFCLFLLLAGWPPVTEMLLRLRWFQEGVLNALVHGVAALSFMPHYESMQRGVVDLRDLAYYVSVIVVMLVGAGLVLENRKAA